MFSLFGVVFLSVVALLLQQNSVYLKVSVENSTKKQELARGVVGAIIMYIACLGVSGYFILSGSRSVDIIESPRFED